ncbi:nucleopolyhedrovirus P10 family protein [Streptomyces sp. TRM68367]|uniref:nucleopolyhedrovirus P10 family protein n=1 Tax=Streptomyces sp. TRM68367 TaxID=2758415 RepID=UPI00165C6DD8|nr:nucleopolyhedrovirus P10 family protein [Streptomyces sp. TRM68367]MBC9731116.1 nucleopolyhedrovirus P10 family protein [Streptomyces sp. TRM68367]
MTTVDRWTQAVRQQLGLGRIVPLGGARDGAWIAETAAEAVLRRAAATAPGVRLDTLRITLADPQDTSVAAVPSPPSALPPGPLRVTADFAATASEPLPTTATRLRATLATAATERLGLVIAEVDLRVTALLDENPEPAPVRPPEPTQATPAADGDEARAATAALTVPGVAHLTAALGHPVHLDELPNTDTALPRRHARVELAVADDHRAVEVARAVRAAVSDALPDHPTVAVLVTAVS